MFFSIPIRIVASGMPQTNLPLDESVTFCRFLEISHSKNYTKMYREMA